ncbi:hypothetical protein IJH46_01130 [Candidatus Saccharibacteria bacterium]|nr:hypothetical protein [Candidatus Saccharibacteria bacterium]
MAEKLTKKQKQILDYISNFLKENNYSPSYREIMAGLGLSSVSAVAEHVENLVEKGALRKNPGVARSLEVVDTSYPETTALFHSKLETASEEETGILLRAAELLGLDLDS